MKGTKVQTLGTFLLRIQQKYHSLQHTYQPTNFNLLAMTIDFA